MKPAAGPSALIALAFSLALAAGPAAAAEPFERGQTVTGMVSLGEKQIPLPEGDWTVAGTGRTVADLDRYGAHGTIESLVLFRLRAGAIDAIAEISANSVPGDQGWGVPEDCTKKDLVLAVNRFRSAWEGSCFVVKLSALRFDGGTPKPWQEAVDFARGHGWTLRGAWVTAAFRESDRRDLVDARFHFDPASQGFAPITAEGAASWSPQQVQANSLKLGYLGQISAWAGGFDRLVDLGLRNQLEAGAPFPDPFGSPAATLRPDLDRKLLMLERLANAGVITPEQQGDLERAALDDRTQAAGESWLPESFRRSAAARVFATAVDWALAFAMTASAPTATWIAASIATVHSGVSLGNSRFWDAYWHDQGAREGVRRLDLEYGTRDL